MIKKLRRSFIITAMISVTAVLAVIVAVMNITNYITSDSEADILLNLLADNGGSFGQQFRPQNNDVPGNGDQSEKPGDDLPEMPPRNEPKMWFDDQRRRDLITAETPYETRFFTVALSSDGSTERIDTGRIAAVSTDDALTMAKKVIASGAESGYSGNFKYLVRKTDTGSLCIFIDRTRALRSVYDFMTISILVALGAAAAVFVLIVIFSGIITKPAAESYEKQKKFITNAGHELKTPLAVINSCTEVIEMEQGESKWTKGITSQTERLSTLTNELVALARMDEGSAQLTFEVFSLSDTVTEILDAFSLMAEQKGLDFITDIQPGITFRGDRSMTAKLCSILADNAVKYTPAGGSIRFVLSAKGRRITLSSENTAEGIEKGAHSELFDRFRRGDSSHSSDIPGSGIGLSMAQSIVTAHGGRIDAISKDGRSLSVIARL